jgi:hypothetical protein
VLDDRIVGFVLHFFNMMHNMFLHHLWSTFLSFHGILDRSRNLH